MRRRRQHYVTASVVAAALLVCGTAAAMAPQPAPPNPDFLAYREQLEEAKQAEPRGCIPHPVNLSHLAGSSIVPLNAREEVRHYAATYDLRTLDQVPPVRNQRTYKICYAFAAQASIESSMLKQDKEKADYSEWQLAYETYNGFVTENDYPPFDRDYSVKWYHLGGVDRQAASVLARWDAPVLESDAPCGGEDPTGKGTVQKHLQKALYLPGIRNEPLDTGNAKYALVHYGAISISMFAGGMADPAVWNKETNAYYYPYDAAPATDHAVNIVGWNDNYPKENFASEPAEDGAWIVRNSWGTDWGDKGYLYISYHSAGLENGVAYTVEKTDNYDNIYQYDPLGLCQAIGFGSDTAWCANVFKTGTGRTTRGTATQGSSGERIKAVSFYSLGGSSMNPAQYTIYVYTDLPDHPDDPCNGDLWEVIDGKLEQAGYVTIPLNNAVPVSKDEVFSIVLQLTTPGYHSPIPVESPVKDYSSFATCGYKESFISPSMTDWDELDLHIDGANVCVKAFTDSLAEPATPTPTPRPATPTPTLIPTLAPQPTRAPTATPAAAPTATPTPGPVPEPEEIGSGDVEPDSEVASMDVEPLDGEDNSGAQQSAQGLLDDGEAGQVERVRTSRVKARLEEGSDRAGFTIAGGGNEMGTQSETRTKVLVKNQGGDWERFDPGYSGDDLEVAQRADGIHLGVRDNGDYDRDDNAGFVETDLAIVTYQAATPTTAPTATPSSGGGGGCSMGFSLFGLLLVLVPGLLTIRR